LGREEHEKNNLDTIEKEEGERHWVLVLILNDKIRRDGIIRWIEMEMKRRKRLCDVLIILFNFLRKNSK
jgi:hypothetical protein